MYTLNDIDISGTKWAIEKLEPLEKITENCLDSSGVQRDRFVK